MNNKELFSLETEKYEAKNMKIILLPYTKYWYLFLFGSILSLGMAFLYLHYTAVPQYKVYSTLLIKDDKNGQGLSNADALSDLSTFKSTSNVDNETEVLKSKRLMSRVVNELSLFISYYVEGPVKDKEIYGTDLPINVLISKVDSTAIGKSFTVYLLPNNRFKLDDHSGVITSYDLGQQVRKPYGTFTIVAASINKIAETKIIVRFQDIQQVANHYNQSIIIQQVVKGTNILYLSLIDPLPERAKRILNKLMDVYNKEAIEDKNIMATNTLRFLDERLRVVTTELSGVEKGVESYKSNNGLTDISAQATDYTAQANSYDKQLSEWAIQIDVLESIEGYLGKATGRYSMVPSTLGIKDETLLGLIGKFNELQLERERMLRTTQPGNPLVQNIDDQLANLRVNILENLKNIKKGLQITSNNLRASSGQFQLKVKRVPAMERELLQINRQQSIKQNIYSYLLQKREETALSLAATASAARVIDPAMGGDYPISPNGQAIYLMSLLLGLGLPLAGIYISRQLNSKVQTQQDITRATDVRILGEIAHHDQDEVVVVTKNNKSPIAEMFRLVRANLQFEATDKEVSVLLVTSSMSGEGKTFFSINLGSSLAITGKRVVLLDLDLREPKIAMELDLPEGLGISDYLIDHKVSIDSIIRYSEKTPGLSIVSAGFIPSNPAELIMSAKFAHLINELKERFDYIILDTPPIGQVADAFALSPFVDFTIYLVRYNYTHKAQLDILNDIHKNKKLNNPFIVLNDAKEVNGNNYGYGYGYGYNSGKSNSQKSKAIR
jgi:tyrosine-protein kinase Etk/Wzc